MKTVNFTHARQNLAAVMDSVVDDAEEIVVTRSRKEPVVVVSLAEYQSMKETDYLLGNPANAAALRRSLSQLEAGLAQEHDLPDPDSAFHNDEQEPYRVNAKSQQKNYRKRRSPQHTTQTNPHT